MKIFTTTTAAAVVLPTLLLFNALKPIEAGLLKTIWQSFKKNGAVNDNTALTQDVDNTALTPIYDVIPAQIDGVVSTAEDAAQQEAETKSLFVDGSSLDFTYWNSDLGNDKPITIEFGNEKQMINYWIKDKPLKVITHGWRGSDEDDKGVFAIKTAYVASGGFNVITADWSRVARNLMYPMPAYLTYRVGTVVAELLENFVNLAVIDPSDIHVMGHSLGAHVSGACGAAFSLGKIGRITGLDPAGPGFEYVALQSERLDSSDAEFVDVIHTAMGTLGFTQAIGHADFYPNEGRAPQPGCFDSYYSPTAYTSFIPCSHSRSHEFYTDSVYHRNAFIAVQCDSWDDYTSGSCKNNTKTPMGHDADPKARGVFYLETNSTSPYAIPSVI